MHLILGGLNNSVSVSRFNSNSDDMLCNAILRNSLIFKFGFFFLFRYQFLYHVTTINQALFHGGIQTCQCSEISPNRGQGIFWVLGIKTKSAVCKAGTLPPVISITPILHCSFFFSSFSVGMLSYSEKYNIEI